MPDGWLGDPRLVVGAMVRVPLQGRRVRGWITALDVDPPESVELVELVKLLGLGPDAELVKLSAWAAWRWAGRRSHFLRTASPPRLIAAPARSQRSRLVPGHTHEALFGGEGATLRLPPAADPLPILEAAAARGQALLLLPDRQRAAETARRLRRAGAWVALHPDDWSQAAAGATVVGTSAAAWAPAPQLAAAVVVDEHDEAYRSNAAPTWSARDVVTERARRVGAPCVLLSPVPSLEALRTLPTMGPSRDDERDGWPLVEVVDRSSEDLTRAGLYSPALVRQLRAGGGVACLLNRRGRSQLLACGRCRELLSCDECGAGVRQAADGHLECRAAGHTRPAVCAQCGSTQMRNLRAGVNRVREELAALIGEPVAEVTSDGYEGPAGARVVVGTQAVLHLGRPFRTVCFLELDQELLAPRFRAREQAMALIALAARITGPRGDGGRILLQTRQPQDPVVKAALHADPAALARAERDRRRSLRLPPYGALAVVSGAPAEEFMQRLGQPEGVQVAPVSDGTWYLRAESTEQLCDALAQVERPPGRLRVEMDPLRV